LWRGLMRAPTMAEKRISLYNPPGVCAPRSADKID
jgi:hypothetical protein